MKKVELSIMSLVSISRSNGGK